MDLAFSIGKKGVTAKRKDRRRWGERKDVMMSGGEGVHEYNFFFFICPHKIKRRNDSN
jgi:hypothetical protein